MTDKKLIKINVSNIEIRKEPSKSSKVYAKRDVILRHTGCTKQYKKETWLEVESIDGPVVTGYVPRKYVTNI